MKAISPWEMGTEPDVQGYKEFKQFLMNASFHNAGPSGEWKSAKSNIVLAAEVAINEDWAFWVIKRMFNEMKPLVEWDSFMQTYINILKART